MIPVTNMHFSCRCRTSSLNAQYEQNLVLDYNASHLQRSFKFKHMLQTHFSWQHRGYIYNKHSIKMYTQEALPEL